MAKHMLIEFKQIPAKVQPDLFYEALSVARRAATSRDTHLSEVSRQRVKAASSTRGWPVEWRLDLAHLHSQTQTRTCWVPPPSNRTATRSRSLGSSEARTLGSPQRAPDAQSTGK